MDFTVPERVESLLGRMRRIVEEELQPLERALLDEEWERLEGALAAVRGRIKAEGLWAPQHPAELGGMGLPLSDFGLVSEVLGASPLGHYAFGAQAPDAGNIELLHLHGSDEQRRRWLEPLVAGDCRSCFAMTEPELPGSNPVMLATTAVADGDDWVLDGHKWYTTAAEGAELAIVMAVTDPEAPPHRRASMILVPCHTPGFELVRNLPVMGETGRGFFTHGEVVLRSCRVPRTALLGEAGHGFAMAQERLGPGRIHHVMRWLGICRRALDLACRRAVARPIAPDRVLADKEIVQAWIAEATAAVEAARSLTLATAWKIERQGWKAARREISMIKFHAAGVLQQVLDRALQIHGGAGMTDDMILAWLFRHERAARIYDGPDEVHKLSLARQLLAPYRKPTG